MSSKIQTPASDQEKVAKFNKSRTLIDALMYSDQHIWANILSYDSEYGVYKILKNVLNYYASADFREDENVHSVEDLAVWLYSKGKFSVEKISKINAQNDASFYSWLKTTAIRAIIDSRKKHHMDYSDLDDTHPSEKSNYEERDILLNILNSTELSDFQKFIIQYHDIEGYSPKEIVKMYGTKNQRTYAMNYYYSQRSKALAAMKKVARTL